jgi:spore coat polysaccharide biosynthesis protein SpsF (cytidylyltransferase family)
MSNLQRKATACYGIECFLRKQGVDVTRKTVTDITIKFLKHKGLPYTKYNPRYKGLFTADICNAESVQEHWEEFREWYSSIHTTPEGIKK